MFWHVLIFLAGYVLGIGTCIFCLSLCLAASSERADQKGQ